jgi:hypothetical protein
VKLNRGAAAIEHGRFQVVVLLCPRQICAHGLVAG